MGFAPQPKCAGCRDSARSGRKSCGEANHASQERRSNENCQHCVKHKRWIASNHSTDRCFFGDNLGYVKLVARASLAANDQPANKAENVTYLTTFYDTGATPTNFFKDVPDNFVAKKGCVKIAGEE